MYYFLIIIVSSFCLYFFNPGVKSTISNTFFNFVYNLNRKRMIMKVIEIFETLSKNPKRI